MRPPRLPDHLLQPADGRESRAMRSRWKLRPMTPEAYYPHVTPVALGIPTTITITTTTTIATRQTKRRLP